MIENVKIPLFWLLKNNSWFLKQILVYLSIFDFGRSLEIDLNKFAKSWGVIILESFCITKWLEYGVWFQNYTTFALHLVEIEVILLTKFLLCQIAEDQFGSLGFAGTRLTSDDDALVFIIDHHILKRIFRYAEKMRLLISTLLNFLCHFLSENWQFLARVDRNQDGTSYRSKCLLVHEPSPDSMEKCSLIELSLQAHEIRNSP